MPGRAAALLALLSLTGMATAQRGNVTLCINHTDYIKYAGVQVNTRQDFGWGLYVARAKIDVERKEAVTGIFTFVPQPAATDFLELSKLWRWSEIDFEFIPFTQSPQREHFICSAPFNSSIPCKQLRANGTSDNIPDWQNPIEGVYTDDVIAQAVANLVNRQTLRPNYDQLHPLQDLNTWEGLVAHTGSASPYFQYPNKGEYNAWPLPPNLELPPLEDLIDSVAINVFRTPKGAKSVTVTIAGKELNASFIPNFGRPDKPSDIDNLDLSGFAMTSETFVLNHHFNPYDEYHYYTIKATPSDISFYVDAPGNGRDVDKAVPLRVMSTTDYHLQEFGPSMTGAGEKWDLRSGQRVHTPRYPYFTLGKNQFMYNMWIACGWGGPPSADFLEANSFMTDTAFYPLSAAWSPTAGCADVPLSQTMQYTGKHFDQLPSFSVNFSTWNTETWWFEFQREFFCENAGDNTKNILNVNWNATERALQLTINHFDYWGNRNNVFFSLNPNGPEGLNTTVFVSQPGTPDNLYALATYLDQKHGQNDFFHVPAGDTQAEIHIQVSHNGVGLHNSSCIFVLNNDDPFGYHLFKGDSGNGMACSWVNPPGPTQVLKQTDGSYMVVLAIDGNRFANDHGLVPRR